MSIEKAAAEVLAQKALQGMLPLFAQKILSSEAYKTVAKMNAEADAFAAEADRKIDEIQAETNRKIDEIQTEARSRYKAAREAVATLLSEHGLQAVVDDLKEIREAKEEG